MVWGHQPVEGEMAGQKALPQADAFLGSFNGLVWEPYFQKSPDKSELSPQPCLCLPCIFVGLGGSLIRGMKGEMGGRAYFVLKGKCKIPKAFPGGGRIWADCEKEIHCRKPFILIKK